MAAGAPSRAQTLADLGRRAAETAQQRVPGAPAVVESFERERAAGAGLLARGVAYRFFLWVVPYGLVLAALASEWSTEDPSRRGWRAPSLFGSLGAATVIMLWLFLIARLVVSAAFLNATLWQRKHRRTA